MEVLKFWGQVEELEKKLNEIVMRPRVSVPPSPVFSLSETMIQRIKEAGEDPEIVIKEIQRRET